MKTVEQILAEIDRRIDNRIRGTSYDTLCELKSFILSSETPNSSCDPKKTLWCFKCGARANAPVCNHAWDKWDGQLSTWGLK